jgi:hypothetical protein
VWFGDLVNKINATIYWFVHQKHVVNGLLVAPHNQQEEDVERHALRSSGLLHREASRAKFS